MDAYRELEGKFAQRAALGDALGLLSWDQNVLMPDGAADRRADTMAALEGLSHRLLIAPEIAELLEKATTDGSLWQTSNLAWMRRQYARAMAVPSDLVEALSSARVRSEAAWRVARETSDFESFLPRFQTVLDLTREVGTAVGEVLGLSPYDALLDGFDPGMRQAIIDPIFKDLSGKLPSLLEEVLAYQRAQPRSLRPQGPFPVEAQKKLGRAMMQRMGFDFSRGRLDVSLHPFCGGATDDVRITTRYDEADFLPALFGVIHETGHALYDQGLPSVWRGQPVGDALGMTLHESQSLIMEMQFCRSEAFTAFMGPCLAECFGVDESLPGWNAESLRQAVQDVKPGLIRVDADELTYPAHILVRYRIETDLIAGRLALRDLPEAFNAGIRELLGIEVPDNRQGCLQDIHWPEGLFGYFPCYTLGALTAAQFASAIEQTVDVDGALREGDFAPIRQWLSDHVWSRASSVPPMQLIREATGHDLSADAFLARARRRYLG